MWGRRACNSIPFIQQKQSSISPGYPTEQYNMDLWRRRGRARPASHVHPPLYPHDSREKNEILWRRGGACGARKRGPPPSQISAVQRRIHFSSVRILNSYFVVTWSKLHTSSHQKDADPEVAQILRPGSFWFEFSQPRAHHV